ncbi:MAG TPA: CD225/dispanin family protein [Stackebrandtia sp.]|jgi:hypothetical protein|uniref:CD225/dispanin family protein n=1 Tax=Stackebrandtia sp. TaxID=2023065 RepID=UPI002D34C25F|nr:CD225/dispanin family protein [Stackebrandtia sp.]HZE40216.1 CD225/dispanin family protein [Stackebrandtia sp.]
MSSHSSPGSPPQSWLAGAILTTIFCCMPFGVVAIVYAAQVNSAWARGDYDGAAASADKAKNWTIASAACGLVAALAYVCLVAGHR